jgi:NADH:ubiquinone oxidoreductase subunit 5 (subunit L)/multisubunit Na+/H+ antiporter MnhA subunit
LDSQTKCRGRAEKAFITTRIGDIGLFLGTLALWRQWHTFLR